MSQDIHSFIYRSENSDAKKNSASGAAFYELALSALNNNFYVCGCVWDENLVASHIVSNKIVDLKRMQGSKYVQSNLNDSFKRVISLLKNDENVLFSGTPCQASAMGILAESIRKRDNLVSVAIICHGVPSPLAWESYKEWDANKEGSELVDVNFRNKEKKGYKETYTKFSYASGKEIYRSTYLPVNKFVESGIVYNLSMRQSCTECKAKGINKNIDIILGDWHSAYSGKGSLGTSCITCFTEKGRRYVEENLMELIPIDYSEIVNANGCIENSSKGNPNRTEFFKLIRNSKNWDKIERLYPAKYKVKKFLYTIGLYHILKGKF